LDVWEGEPEIQLKLMERVAIATPHIAGYSFDGKVAGTEMIYHSLCNHLNVEPTVTKRQVLPELDVPTLHWSGNRFPGDIYSYIRQSYDILNDDKIFRFNQLNSVAPGEEFDKQRKTYPVRREFGNYCLPQQVSSRLKNALLELGFRDVH
jgi:erythronate-4-phosphate dehydrogenase